MRAAVLGTPAVPRSPRVYHGWRGPWRKPATMRPTPRALGRGNDTYECGVRDEPEWGYWLNGVEIDIMAGRFLIELGWPADAEPLLASAIAHYPLRTCAGNRTVPLVAG